MLGGTWSALGPQPIRNVSTFGDVSGRVTALAVNPNNSNIVYAGTAGGGIWKTVDGGSHWVPLTDGQLSLSIGAIALDPSNPEVIYAGTGEANDCGDCQYTRGILKSTDGGQRWQLMDQADFDGSYLQISSIVVDRLNVSHVLAATTGGLAVSRDGGVTWAMSGELDALSSTTSPEVWAIVEDPSNPQIFYTAVGERCGDYGFVARSNDSGNTWPTNYELNLGVFAPVGYPKIQRTALGVGPGGVLYAALAACPSATPSYGLGQLVAVLKSTDRGLHWSRTVPGGAPGLSDLFEGAPGFFQGDYGNVVAVDPTDANRVVFGGVTMLTTADGGASFTDVAHPYSGGPLHPDVHAVAFTGAARSFYTGNDGGVYKTTDFGGSGLSGDWTNLNATLAVTTFYHGTALDSNTMIGGSQGNDIVGLLPGGPTPPAWRPLLDGDGTWTAMDPSSHLIYGELAFGDIWKGDSTNPAAWQRAGPCATTADPACADPVEFVAPFVMDPTNPAWLYAGTNRVYRSQSGGLPAGSAGWTAISPDLTTGTNVLPGGDDISAMAMDGHDTVVTGSYGGRVMLTTNASAASPTWVDIAGTTLPGFFPGYYTGNPWITSLAVRGSHIWATVATTVGPRVFHLAYAPNQISWLPLDGTQDSSLGSGVPLWVTVDPADSNTIFVGMDGGASGSPGGVFVCGNCAATVPTPVRWGMVGSALPNARVDAVTLSNDGASLLAWTHGRGVWSVPRRTRLAASPSPLDFGPQNVVDPASQLNLTVQNIGLKDSSGLTTASISGPNAADFTVGPPATGAPSCAGATLSPLATCLYGVSFKPSAEGSRTATLTITDAQGASVTVTLTGSGGHATASFNPSSPSFGTVGLRTSNVLVVTATNTGTGPLVFSGATQTGSTDFAAGPGGCLEGHRIAPGGTCQLFLTFTPQGLGNETATLSLKDNTAGSPELLQLSGFSQKSTVSVSASTLAFGDVLVGSSKGQSVIITNTGTVGMVGDQTTGTTPPYSVNNQCFGESANPNSASCWIGVTFQPTGTGEVDQTLTIPDNSTTSPHQVQLTGRGVAPVSSYSKVVLAFNNQPIGTISPAQTITLTNSGTAPLHVSSITKDDPKADFTETNNCNVAIAPNGSCTMTVTFRSYEPGTFHAQLNVFSDSGFANPQVLYLDGTAVSPLVSMDKTSLQFPWEGPGQTSPSQTITVKNTGNADLVVSAITTSPDFPQTNTCTSGPIAAGATCTITVSFAPTAGGQRGADLTITDNRFQGKDVAYLYGLGAAGFTSFRRLGANMSSAAAVTSSGSGRLDVLARGQDNALYYRSSTDAGGTWSEWSRINATTTSAPSATSSRPGRVDVVARGGDNALYYTYSTDGGKTWVYWTRVAASMTSAPAISSWGSGRLDVVARGGDLALYHTSSDDGGASWRPWTRIAAAMTSDPAITSWGTGRLDVFGRGRDNALYHISSTDGGVNWNSWERIAGNLATAPAASTWGVNRLDLFAVGQDSNVYHTWVTDGATWHYWELVQGAGYSWTAKPAVVSRGQYNIDIMERGLDNALYFANLNPF